MPFLASSVSCLIPNQEDPNPDLMGPLLLKKHLPGGAPAGCLLGGLIFILKFNGAFLRPKIPRPIGQFFHAKYFDDVSAAASIDLKKSLRKDTIQRQRPLKYNENSQLVLPYCDNPLQKAS